MTTIYISGPIKGDTMARQKFFEAANQLHAAGYVPCDPFRVDPICLSPCLGEFDESHYDCYMRGDIAELMRCDALAYLPGWEASKGAMTEIHLARQINIPVNSLAYYLERSPE